MELAPAKSAEMSSRHRRDDDAPRRGVLLPPLPPSLRETLDPLGTGGCHCRVYKLPLLGRPRAIFAGVSSLAALSLSPPWPRNLSRPMKTNPSSREEEDEDSLSFSSSERPKETTPPTFSSKPLSLPPRRGREREEKCVRAHSHSHSSRSRLAPSDTSHAFLLVRFSELYCKRGR